MTQPTLPPLIVIFAAGALYPVTVTAQMIIGADAHTSPSHYLNIENSDSLQLFTPWIEGSAGPLGMSADDEQRIVYFVDGWSLFRMPYDTLDVEFVADVTVDGAPAIMQGLAWDSGQDLLLASRSDANLGIYQIDVETGAATAVFLHDPTLVARALAFDDARGVLYGSFNADAIYAIDLVNQTLSLTTPARVPSSDEITGLSAYDGILYLYDVRRGSIDPFDTDAGVFRDRQNAPLRVVGVEAAAAWAPGLASRLLLADPAPGLAAERNRFAAIGATPGASVYFAYSARLGVDLIPGCPDLTTDLHTPTLIGAAVADASGTAVINRTPPGSAFGTAVYFQAFEPSTCTRSNVFQFRFF